MKNKKRIQFQPAGDERMQSINLQSSTIGYLVAMVGLFISMMVADFLPSLNLVRNLLFLTFFGAMTASVIYSVTRDGHPFLTKQHEKKARWTSLGLIILGILITLLGLFGMVAAITDKNGVDIDGAENGISFLLFGVMSFCEGVIILRKLIKNQKEEEDGDYA
ncbi:hypothetical protein [Streptococcus dentiloxodontae]